MNRQTDRHVAINAPRKAKAIACKAKLGLQFAFRLS